MLEVLLYGRPTAEVNGPLPEHGRTRFRAFRCKRQLAEVLEHSYAVAAQVSHLSNAPLPATGFEFLMFYLKPCCRANAGPFRPAARLHSLRAPGRN